MVSDGNKAHGEIDDAGLKVDFRLEAERREDALVFLVKRTNIKAGVEAKEEDAGAAEFAEDEVVGDSEDGLCGGRVKLWKWNDEGKAMGPTMVGRSSDVTEAVVIVPEPEMLERSVAGSTASPNGSRSVEDEECTDEQEVVIEDAEDKIIEGMKLAALEQVDGRTMECAVDTLVPQILEMGEMDRLILRDRIFECGRRAGAGAELRCGRSCWSEGSTRF